MKDSREAMPQDLASQSTEQAQDVKSLGYRYIPQLRPASFATVPSGWTYAEMPPEHSFRRPELPRSRHRFGVIQYDHPLTKAECDDYSLEEVTGETPVIPEIKEMVTAIHTELESRDVSHEEFNNMRAELYLKAGEQRAEERMREHDPAVCHFCGDEKSLAEKMDESLLIAPGSGKKVERFRGIAI